MNRTEALEQIRNCWHRTVGPMSKEDYVWIVGEVHADMTGFLMSIEEESEEDED